MNTQELQYAIGQARRKIQRLQSHAQVLDEDLADAEEQLRDAYEELNQLEDME